MGFKRFRSERLLPSYQHLRQYCHGPAVALTAGTDGLCLEGVVLGTKKCKEEKLDSALPLEAYKSQSLGGEALARSASRRKVSCGMPVGSAIPKSGHRFGLEPLLHLRSWTEARSVRASRPSEVGAPVNNWRYPIGEWDTGSQERKGEIYVCPMK
jgi:hypothetical protein